MLSQQEIERMFADMAILSETDRRDFIEWSKVTLKPAIKGHAFIRIATTTLTDLTDEAEGGERGGLERDIQRD